MQGHRACVTGWSWSVSACPGTSRMENLQISCVRSTCSWIQEVFGPRQVLSSPATVMKAFEIDALIAREYGRAGIAAAGRPCRKAKTLAISMILCGTTKACGPHTFTFAQALIEACDCFCCNGMQGGGCLRWLCYQFYAKYFCRSVTMQSCWHCAGLKVFEFHGDVSWFKEIFGPRASVRHIL